ncbi:hypothetical protein AKJ53_01145 [candidate division MSBL1 archaeon SCGC-AAA382F02]|uniref:PIN domain-containing protein n=1 Tax=candidate division MSBL1 archaeon SCGC-AAA382F02 TaxID=1698282 RepID=A0A133VIA9_9EURY|nr:hypothetical protein AKJ53_01145 [candidate division MSBL1 archaeon SCGC-AAA382F02]
MLVVKDAMVLIHLSKMTLLRDSCELFDRAMVPARVYEEAVERGKRKDYEDAFLIEEVVKDDLIRIKDVKNPGLIERANKFNIQAGEAEAVALYWQEGGDLLATDDDNVRKKSVVLELDLIGTPTIILKLFKSGKVKEKKFHESLDTLRKIGWFSNAVLDRVLERGEKHA